MGRMTTTEPAVLPQPDRAEIRVDQVLQALGEPVRLQILRAVADAPPEGVACGEFPLPVGKSTRTHHLRILREAGVISSRMEGTRRMITLRRDDLNALYPGLLDGVLAAEQ
jgi:DNA-binding transcriptional ArsR family regulator